MSVRILIAEDHQLIRDGLRKILEADPDMQVVGEAGDGLEAVDGALGAKPDVVLMDIRMPRLDGIEATRRIVGRAGERVRVLILTTFGHDEYVFESLRAGASGFLLKDAPAEELLAAVRTVAAGDALISPSVTRAVIEEFARGSPLAARPHPELGELTDREREVLGLLTGGSPTPRSRGRWLSAKRR